jgi:hypothetical protein
MHMNIYQYACQNMTSTLVSGLFVMFIASLDLQKIPLLKKMSTLSVCVCVFLASVLDGVL